MGEPCPEILARDGRHGESKCDHRQEAGLDDAHADAKARLRCGSEWLTDRVNHDQVNGDESELSACGQADLQDRAPQVESRCPVASRELQA